ncbi:hypothetical protein CKJ65_16455 [Mycobacterium intracellulare]|nr:hypothetical protein CKJ65_16455 [Mycobacterium intracellulare]
MSAIGLFDAVGIIPALPGARCRGRSTLFEETECPESTEFAINLCRGCPALTACGQWFDALPPNKRPHGVVAGRINPQPVGRPRKANA